MTTILTAPLSTRSTRTPYNRFSVDQSDRGYPRARLLTKPRVWTFTLVWENRPKSDAIDAEKFWRAQRIHEFIYRWPLTNEAYRAVFLKAPQWTETAYRLYEITISIRGLLDDG